MREWAVKLEAEAEVRGVLDAKDFPWTNSHHITDDLRTANAEAQGRDPRRRTPR